MTETVTLYEGGNFRTVAADLAKARTLAMFTPKQVELLESGRRTVRPSKTGLRGRSFPSEIRPAGCTSSTSITRRLDAIVSSTALGIRRTSGTPSTRFAMNLVSASGRPTTSNWRSKPRLCGPISSKPATPMETPCRSGRGAPELTTALICLSARSRRVPRAPRHTLARLPSAETPFHDYEMKFYGVTE